MAREIIFMVEESPDGGFEAQALGYSIFIEADTYEELREAARDGVKCRFEDNDKPEIIRLHLVRDDVIAV
ncbi:MAG: 2-oxoisovalerate dehydrogenase [Candidatus Aquicultorales bacterium]